MAQATQIRYAGPATGTERSLAEVLAEVVGEDGRSSYSERVLKAVEISVVVASL